MFERSPGFTSRGFWSVGHGAFERYPALAFPGSPVDPGDCPAHGTFLQYDPQIANYSDTSVGMNSGSWEGPHYVIQLRRCHGSGVDGFPEPG